MKEKRFIREVKIALYYILEYGIKSIEYKGDIFSHINNIDNMRSFVIKVHEGFMFAQKNIIFNLLYVLKEQKSLKQQTKELRRSRADVSECDIKQKNLKYQELIFRKLADTIAWQLLEQDLTVMRRLYNFAPEIDISNSNLGYDMKVIEEIFDSDSTRFPLLTDITSFIQVGDVLIKDYFEGKISLLELKEGKVNEEIERIIDTYGKTKCDHMLYLELKDRDKNFTKQFDRYIKQHNKIATTINTINNNEGIDHRTGFNVEIHDEVFETRHFEEKINDMLVEVDKKNYSITVIDKCLLVGVYNRKNIPIDRAFSAWIKSQSIEFPEIDIMNSTYTNLAYPIFLHPFSMQDKVKLVTGEKTIKLSLDIYKWLELAKDYGLSYRKLSKKETARINSRQLPYKAFEVNGHALELEYKGVKNILYDGIFGRMMFQFLRPMSAIEFIKTMMEKAIN